MSVEISNKERYKILTPKSIIIGDNSYLERIEKGNNSLKKFCTILKRLPRTLNSELIFFAQESVINGDEYITYIADIVMSVDEKTKDVFYEGNYHPSLVSYRHNLGCDTASYNIYVNKDRYEHVGTGMDGEYGYHMAYKSGAAHLIEITFNDDMYSETQIRKMLSYLFNVQHEEFLTRKVIF